MRFQEFIACVDSLNNRFSKSGKLVQGPDVSLEDFTEYVTKLDNVLSELEYYSHLVSSHEIQNRRNIKYHEEGVRTHLLRIGLAYLRIVHLYLVPLEGFRKITIIKLRIRINSLMSHWKLGVDVNMADEDKQPTLE